MSDLNDNILNMFSNIIETEDSDNQGTQGDPNDPLTSNIGATVEKGKGGKGGKGKSKQKKLVKTLRSTIAEQGGVYRLSSFNYQIVKNATLKSVGFDDLSIDLENSWLEFLIFLIGSAYTNFKQDSTINSGYARGTFEEELAKYGVFNQNIKLIKEQPIHLDSEISRGLELYRIPGTEYMIELYYDEESIFNSIVNVLSSMYIFKEDVQLELVNNAYMEDEEFGEYGDEGNSEELESLYIDEQSTLAELSAESLLECYRIKSVELDGSEVEVGDIRELVLLLLMFIAVTADTDISSTLKEYSITDVIGVTDDSQDYIGIMRTTLIPNTNLYFYTNGSKAMMIEYLCNICKALKIDINSIKVNYRMLMIM